MRLAYRPGYPYSRADGFYLFQRHEYRARRWRSHVGSCPCTAFTVLPDVSAGQSHAIGEPMMSLSAWEQRALDSLKDGLAGSDPQLTVLLTTFTRLASGEEMPGCEEIQAGSRRAIQRPGRGRRYPRRQTMRRHARPAYRRLGLQRAVLLLWLLITVVLIPLALLLSRGGSQDTCTGSWVMSCTNSTHAPSSRPAAP
jgi:hypothetical protein